MSLKDKRQQAGLLQSDIAERLNIDRSTVAKWENGEALPRANRLVQLAKIYNCTIEELLVKEGNEDDKDTKHQSRIGSTVVAKV